MCWLKNPLGGSSIPLMLLPFHLFPLFCCCCHFKLPPEPTFHCTQMEIVQVKLTQKQIKFNFWSGHFDGSAFSLIVPKQNLSVFSVARVPHSQYTTTFIGTIYAMTCSIITDSVHPKWNNNKKNIQIIKKFSNLRRKPFRSGYVWIIEMADAITPWKAFTLKAKESE